MLVGYARLGQTEKDPRIQVDALQRAGCQAFFIDRGVTSVTIKRPEFDSALSHLRPGDILVVVSLDRIGRSVSDLLSVWADLGTRHVGFRSLTEAIDTNGVHGEAFADLLHALSRYETSLVLERTLTGLTAAKNGANRVGRKRKLNAQNIEHARIRIAAGESPDAVAKAIGVSLATLYRAIPAPKTNRHSIDLFSTLN